MNLPFFVADTLGVTLYQVKSGLKASEMREVTMGPWRLDVQMDVDSDLVFGHEMGLWVTLAKSLRLYLILREKETWLFVLDTDKLKVVGEKTGFAGLTLKARTQEFKPAVKGLFRWKDSVWEQVQYDGIHGG